jgi:hypothetical protein
MKHSFILFLLWLTFNQSLSAQTSYCLTYEIVSKSPTVVLKVSIAASTAFNLGEANIAFNYNNNAMGAANSTVVSTTLGAVYTTPTVTDPANGLTSINFDFNGTTGQGLPISITPTEIARISFPILNAALATGFSINTTYCKVYNDNSTPVLLSINAPCPTLNVVIQDIVLPLEWLDFQARANTQQGIKNVDLIWSTASEYNVQHFAVERSLDGKRFEQVGAIINAKNKPSQNTYYIADKKPLSGTSYYRIREVDLNGKQSFSNIRSIILDAEKTVFTIYPNPKARQESLGIQTNWTENFVFNLYDATGKLVYSRKCKGNVELEDLELVPGFYLFDCTTPQDKIVGKIIVPD